MFVIATVITATLCGDVTIHTAAIQVGKTESSRALVSYGSSKVAPLNCLIACVL